MKEDLKEEEACPVPLEHPAHPEKPDHPETLAWQEKLESLDDRVENIPRRTFEKFVPRF